MVEPCSNYESGTNGPLESDLLVVMVITGGTIFIKCIEYKYFSGVIILMIMIMSY